MLANAQSEFLSPDELRDLTQRARRADQAAELTAMGIPHLEQRGRLLVGVPHLCRTRVPHFTPP